MFVDIAGSKHVKPPPRGSPPSAADEPGDEAMAMVDEVEESADLGRREAGKAERRARIIAAARELIREKGDDGLSMRALAARAGVSLATPYNLFGSKRAIVLAVLQDVREFHERFSILHITDPLERIFVAKDMEVACYVDDPDVYKVMWSAVFDTTDNVRSTLFNPRRDAFWLGLIDDAANAGALLEGVDARLLLQQLDHMARSVMLDWIHGEVDLALLRPTMRHGVGLILGGAAAAEWRGPIVARMLEAQRSLCAARAANGTGS
jgi:AcrR family transcriptional regulator